MRHGRDGARDLVVLAELGDCLEGMDNGEIVVFAHRAVISPFGLSLDRCLVSMYAPSTCIAKKEMTEMLPIGTGGQSNLCLSNR